MVTACAKAPGAGPGQECWRWSRVREGEGWTRREGASEGKEGIWQASHQIRRVLGVEEEWDQPAV